MKRIALLILSVFLAGAFYACSGSDGANGVAGAPGKPQPVKVVMLGSDNSGAAARVLWFNATGKLPQGSTINYINVADSIPPVSELQKYNCGVLYTNNTATDPVALGNRMADWVDAGGKLVVLQAAFSNPYSITGRLMNAAYSPLTVAAAAGDGADKTLDLSTIAFPLHKIFVGIDLPGYVRPGVVNYSVPGVQSNATVLASFNGGLVAVAINANKTIIAINDFPGSSTESVNALAANCVMYLSGKI